LHSGLSSTSTVSVSSLKDQLSCRVVGPDDAGYDDLRAVFSGGIDRRPAVIIRPANAADVAQAVSVAREIGLPLAIRNGGHSLFSATDGGILLDLRDLNSFEIDADRRTAWAGAGLTAIEYTKAAAQHGLATGFGDTGSVGISGITLGGGIGYLTRKYGLTIDSLLGAELVTANGQLLQVNAESHPDLFWAIRGGGGNFGVVTRFHFQLHPVDQIVGGMMLLPASADTIVRAMDAAAAAPEELSAIINIMPAPPMPFVPQEHQGKLSIMLLLCYAGDVETGNQVMGTFRAIAKPIVDMVRPIKYPELYPPDDPNYHPKAVGRTFFLDHFTRGAADIILEYLQRSDAPMRVTQLRVLGGAMARVPADATAFAHRTAPIMGVAAAFFTGPEDRPSREAWTTTLTAALQQGNSGAYVNFLGDEGEGRIRAAYPGKTWNRLAAIKAQYDPENLFRMNQNIPPRG
jgi:UDP-N-acetylenolpyruvoylglucosamine reductase